MRLVAALAVGALLVLAPLAARAQAAPGDFPTPLFLTATGSAKITTTVSHQLAVAGTSAPTADPTVAAGGAGVLNGSYLYVYSIVDPLTGETAPTDPPVATPNLVNQSVVVSGLPTTGTVRLYRRKNTSTTTIFVRVTEFTDNATGSYTDNATDASLTTPMPQPGNRVSSFSTAYADFAPGISAPNSGSSPPASSLVTPSGKGWIFDVAGPVSFKAGDWKFSVRYRSGTGYSGSPVAHFVVGMWKVKTSGGAITSSTQVINPVGAGENTTNLVNPTGVTQSLTHTVPLGAVTLAAGEHLYVQFWRRQTTSYTVGNDAARMITMYTNDGVADVEHPPDDYTPPNPFTITAPASGAYIKNGEVLTSDASDPTPDLVSVDYYRCDALADCSFPANRTLIGSLTTSPYSFTWTGQPADGAYQLVAIATDNVGNTSETPVLGPVHVDNTAPDTTLTSTPSDPSNASASFAFSSPDPGTFQCSLDGAPFAACTSPQAYTGLATGSHTFQVRAVDLATNVDASPATLTWTVDATAPTVSFTSTPSNPTASSAASFSFNADETATFECRLDGASFATCASPRNLTSLADGSHTYEVRATDGVGNVGSATYTWTVDTITPVVTFTSTPPALSGSASASFSFNVSEPGTVECRVDTAAYAACSSPHALTGLADGSHTFDVRATDAVGHVGSATYTWTIDTVTPTVTFTSMPPSLATTKAASFSFSVSEPATIECGLDGGVFVACTSPRNLSNLGDGSHTFEVRATDGVGHVGSATYTWTVDTVTPVVSFSATPQSVTNNPTATFSFGANEPATLECRLDGGAYAACASPKLVFVTDGTHTFDVRATDAAGHAGTASFSWTVDTLAPSAPALDQPATGALTRSLRLSAVYTGPEAGSKGAVEFHVCTDAACTNVVAHGLSAQVAQGQTASWTIDVGLADGTYFWQARSIDLAGNASGWANIRTFTRDTVKPAAPGGFTGVVAGDGLTLRWTAPAGDQIGNYVVFVDGKQWRVLGEVTYEVKIGAFDAGDTRSFTVSAVDKAGNEGPQTTPLVGVPDVVGLSVPAAKDAIETRGLVLDELRTVHAEGAPRFVLAQTPPAPALAARGSAVDVVVGTLPATDSRPLVEIKTGRVCGTRGNLNLQVRLLERAKVTLTIYNARSKRLVTKRLGIRPPGLTNHHLKLKTLTRPGRYRVVVTAKAGGRSGRDTMTLTVRRAKTRIGC